MSQSPAEHTSGQQEYRQIGAGGLVMVFEIERADGEVALLLNRRQAAAVRDALRWLTTHLDPDASAPKGNDHG